jgi:hypothetical protein
MANGEVVLDALDPARLCDADLPGICLRMSAILSTIEMPRCEGRLLPRDIFDRIDTLYDHLRHGPSPKLPEWVRLIADFGEYYGLEGVGPISVDPDLYREEAARFTDVPKREGSR